MHRIFIFILVAILHLEIYGQNFHEIDTSKVYSFADSMPTSFDGLDIITTFRNHLHREFDVPDTLVCVISKIHIEFVVSYTGELIEKKITFPYEHDSCASDYVKLREAVLRVLDNIPKCRAGMHNGKYVNVKFIIPLNISLQ